MKNLTIIYSILICFMFSVINAQENEVKQYVFAKFEIKDVRYNKGDVTQQFLEGNASILLYKSSDDNEILFSVFWDKNNSQSYGPIYMINKKGNSENEDGDKSDLYSFHWSYTNTYDNKEGTAEVKLLAVYKPQGTYFEITILPENLDEVVYKGRMEGDFMAMDFNIKKQNEKS